MPSFSSTLTDAIECHHSQVLSLMIASAFIHQSTRFDSVPLGTGSPLWHISFHGAVLARVSLGCHSTTGSGRRTPTVGLVCLWRSVSSRHCREVPPRNSTSYYPVFVAQESCSTKLDLATRCHHKLKRVYSLSSLCKQPGHRQSRSLSSLKAL